MRFMFFDRRLDNRSPRRKAVLLPVFAALFAGAGRALLGTCGTTFMGSGTSPFGVCSDGLNFWVALSSVNQIARF